MHNRMKQAEYAHQAANAVKEEEETAPVPEQNKAVPDGEMLSRQNKAPVHAREEEPTLFQVDAEVLERMLTKIRMQSEKIDSLESGIADLREQYREILRITRPAITLRISKPSQWNYFKTASQPKLQ